MTPTATWSYPTPVRFGAGRIAEAAEACRAAGIARPLVVTDPGVAAQPFTAALLDALEAEGMGRGIFAETDANPTGEALDAALAMFREGGFDGVLALGGGSALDLGKAVAFMAGQTRPVWDFEDVGDWWTRADADAIRPVVAVPTTAGTGSEVGRASVLTNAATGEKKIIFHPRMLPAQVICDPELTVGMPPAITAGTGLDALAHCMEAWCSPHFHPMSAGIAIEGLRLVKENLPRVMADPADLPARAEMMAAAAMGAVAFQKGLGAVHALSHPIGARHHTHHGTTNAVILPHVLRANRAAVEDRMIRAAAYLGLTDGFDGVLAWVEALNRDLKVPESLTALGVTDPDVDALVEAAMRDPSSGGNPVEMTPAWTRALLEACL